MTWPLAAGLGRDIPWDLGDSLLNCWIIGWVDQHVGRFLTGHPDAFRGFWTANIFYPAPLTLAYSEHLVVPALQVFPLYAATRNLILCYNVLFLSTFVLSGLGTYLLVRDLTGRPAAAFVAGLVYAFAPYRIGQYSHLQVLSSQWMPFALFGFRRYFATRRFAPLAGGALAAIAQNLSCGYFMLFFAPFLAAYVLYEIADRSLWRDGAVWRDLVLAAVAIAGATAPFVMPYLELRRQGFPPRPIDEVVLYSADVYGYLTAHGAQRLYGSWLRAFPKAEGDLFPAWTPMVLAAAAIGVHVAATWRGTRVAEGRRARMAFWAATLLVATHVAAIVIIFLSGGVAFRIGPLSIRAGNLWRIVLRLIVALPIAALVSARARRFLRGTPGSALAFYAAAAAAAFWLSLGPVPTGMGRRLGGAALYWYFYEYVPGFDGLRVPARLAMLVALFLAVLAGYGAAAIEARWRRAAWIVGALGCVFLVEAAAVPLEVNGTFASDLFVTPPSRIATPARAPEVYRYLRTMPPSAIVAEFPFGDYAYELRYMYYSTIHWKRLLNGYSGGFPPEYFRYRAAFMHPADRPDLAFEILRESGATHAVVHEAAFRGDEGAAVSAWLRGHGAQPVATFGRDLLFALPR
jgi:hypothetical protein